MARTIYLTVLIFILSVSVLTCTVTAEIVVPKIFSDNMILQQESDVNFWGWAEPNEKIIFSADWLLKPQDVHADANGSWSFKVKTPKSDGNAHKISFHGNKNNYTFQNILLGEVWLCSGQSNMYWQMSRTENAQLHIQSANYPDIRLFKIDINDSEKPLVDVNSNWEKCDPDTIPDFSAVAYFFGKNLHEKLSTPIGLIQSAYGGTPVEAWMTYDSLKNDPDYQPILQRHKENKIIKKNNPGALYNAMINPIAGYTIKGIIWYQGEANRNRAYQYRKLFPDMIENWRNIWQNPDLPFYFVQIAPYNYGDLDVCPELQQAQLITHRKVANTGMVVVTDIGDVNNIHPKNKLDVGKRLANWALAKTYGFDDITYSGPIYKSFKIENDKIRIFFDYADDGLISKDGQLREFQIAGKDRQFVPAKAIIDANTVIISSPEVEEPIAVRFGWRNTAQPNLFNAAGLPASPFRTDNFPGITIENK